MFQGKSDVQALKHGEVSSQARKVPTSLSSKQNDLMKQWKRTSKVDDLLKMSSRNAQKVSPRCDEALKSSKDYPQGKEDASPSQVITKISLMAVIKPTSVGRPSNHVRNISKRDENEGCLGISNVACVKDVHVCNIRPNMPWRM
jgi:hypothetical protein